MSNKHDVTRRTFLTASSVLPFALKGMAAQRKVPVGLELYSVRNEFQRDQPSAATIRPNLLPSEIATVTAVAKMGYEVVEFWSPYLSWTPETAKQARKLLDDLGIKCLSTHNGMNALTGDGLQKAIELNQIMGSKYIVAASAGGSTPDAWKAHADTFSAAVEKLRPLGMSAGFHNHQTEWRALDATGTRAMDIIAKNTPRDFVLQLDVGTCVEAGQDPVAWINANPGRIKNLHCKDWAPGPGYAVLFGEGACPWMEIFKAAESTGGVEYYLIEQEAGPVTEQLLRSERCLANYKKMRANG